MKTDPARDTHRLIIPKPLLNVNNNLKPRMIKYMHTYNTYIRTYILYTQCTYLDQGEGNPDSPVTGKSSSTLV